MHPLSRTYLGGERRERIAERGEGEIQYRSGPRAMAGLEQVWKSQGFSLMISTSSDLRRISQVCQVREASSRCDPAKYPKSLGFIFLLTTLEIVLKY
jgi:hypothetical protein